MKFWFEIITASLVSGLAVWYWVQLRQYSHDVAFRLLVAAITVLGFTLATASISQFSRG